MNNPHPTETGEYLACACLAEANGDWSLAMDLIFATPICERQQHAAAALALWVAIDPPANDKVIYPGIWPDPAV